MRFQRPLVFVLLCASFAPMAAGAMRAPSPMRAVALAPAPQASQRPAKTQRRARGSLSQARAFGPSPGTTLLGDAFSESATPADAYLAAATSSGDACLTAGTASTPSTSLRACGTNASQDADGQGALQVVMPSTTQAAMVLNQTPVSTAHGLSITFTYYSFNGTSPGADGLAFFLTDATQAAPTSYGGNGGGLGYGNVNGSGGVANGYLAIGLDEWGNFSAPAAGNSGTGDAGGPGVIPESLAVRGAASQDYMYLGGAEDASGSPASLPFDWDQQTPSRPAVAPTVRITLTPAGLVTAAVDIHDGNGFVTYYSKNVVGQQIQANGTTYVQPAVPSKVYVGFSAGTGGAYTQKQVGSFNVSTLTSTTNFAPNKLADLKAWYDASNPADLTLAASGTHVSGWKDLSGNGNDLSQAASGAQPAYASGGFGGLGAVTFAGKDVLATGSPFLANLLDASTVFIVGAAPKSNGDRTLMWSGVYASNPRWSLFSTGSLQSFAFNATGGLLATNEPASGAAIWTAGGSSRDKKQLLRKNGNAIGSATALPSTSVVAEPLALGATLDGSGHGHAFYKGSIAEVLVYHRYLSLAQQQTVEGYLACKWGLQSSLPANHPYRYVCPQSAPPPAPLPTPTPVAGSVQNPAEIRSTNGTLIFNVVAQQNASTGNPELTYNGSTTPPTLRVLPGDTLLVNLTNDLPPPPASATYSNATNLHFHGMHVSPNAPADDSIDMLAAPGQVLHYRVPIPANAPPGLFWYHSHAHGEAERQNLAGMSGALIVDGIATYAPAVSALPERVLMIRDVEPAGQPLPGASRTEMAAMRWSMQHPGGGRNPYAAIDPNYRTFKRPATDTHCQGNEVPVLDWTINGLPTADQNQLPTIGIRPGERQFWRVVNAGSDTWLDLAVDHASLEIVAIDGVPISEGSNAPAQMSVPNWILPPASRVEFIVTGPAAGSSSYLRTLCFDDGPAGAPMPAFELARLDPDAAPAAMTMQRVLAKRPPAMHNAAYVKAHKIARTQTVYYSDQNTINGVAYDPSAPPLFYAQSGTVEEWTIVNNSAQGHTFHIHQVHFLVESINGIKQSQQFLMDNVNVPPATGTGPGMVKVLIDFTDPLIVGTFLLHCHVLSHEDGGMMAKIRVGTAPPLVLKPASVQFSSPSAPPAHVTVKGGQAPYQIDGCAGVANASIYGKTITLVPVAAGSCVLTVTDSTQLSNNLDVNVSPAVPVVKLDPTSVSFTSPTAPAQNVTISGGTPPYTAAGCQGTVTATIASSAMTVTPVAQGSCTITVTDSANNSNNLSVSVNLPQTGFPQDNVTFHQNTMRTGWYDAETTLTTTNVASSSFKWRTTLTAPAGMPPMGKVYAQPLYASQELMPDGNMHNLVIVATSTDQLYAFDDQTRTVLWHHDFTNPAAGIRQQLWSDDGCPDVNPNIGITGTPVIDRSADLLYVVVPTYENGTFYQRIHAISLKTGSDAVNGEGNPIGPTVITATVAANGGTASIDPLNNFNRSALLEANGTIYVALGSHCDYVSNTTHGWVVGYDAATLAPVSNIINTTSDNQSGYFLGSPWMGGFGPAADASGNIFFATGNGPDPGTDPVDYGMSVLDVPGNLDLSTTTANGSWFSPKGAAGDASADADLGSGGVLLFPDETGNVAHILAIGGKCGAGGTNGTTGCHLYVLNRDNMGKQQAGDAGALVNLQTGCGMWGGPAFFEDASSNQYLVYGCGSPLATYKLGLSPVSLTQVGGANVGCLECRDSGSQPIVSSNGTKAGTAVVWALQTPGNAGGTITLFAFNALDMSQSAGPCLSQYNGAQCIFESPVVPPPTTLTQNVAQGATTLPVASVAGIAQGMTISINGTQTDDVVVASVNPSTNTITTVTGTAYAHDSGYGLSVVAWAQTPGTAWIGGALVSPLVANGTVYVPFDGGVAVFGLK
ncbi:MAG TPA: multicopper oxidase domain-containing protein [Candidatus Acidoferrales bacterium]|nr:multicopper oxidase domain-containing protein [Candidatus Acidoferrales bacterium]